MNGFKKIFTYFILVLCVFPIIFSCASGYDSSKDIVILYTGDAEGAVDSNIGYAGVAKYKKDMLSLTPNVTLVDTGNAISGSAFAYVSSGQRVVEIMNKVGYDFAVLGNHEFDYGLDALSDIISLSKAQYLACNIKYTGNRTDKISSRKPYAMVNYGGIKVAFIGVVNPETVKRSNTQGFLYKNEVVYEFSQMQDLYNDVQYYVDHARHNGARYVIALTHLGINRDDRPNTAMDLIENTEGIDIVIDSNSHGIVEASYYHNKSSEEVLYTQAGAKLSNIGMLTITPKGEMRTQLISEYEKDPFMVSYIEGKSEKFEKQLDETIASSEVDLSITREDGSRAIRNREAAIGSFCSDALRAVSGADIAFVNAGNIRSMIKKGKLSTKDIMDVFPYLNRISVMKVTGQQILDALEHASRFTTFNESEIGSAQGEFSGFLHVSGLRYTIDTNVQSTVNTYSKGFFAGVSGRRRIKNVQVEKKGEWVTLVPNATYTLALMESIANGSEDGFTMFGDAEYITKGGILDIQVLLTYINDYLAGNIPALRYSYLQGRITVL